MIHRNLAMKDDKTLTKNDSNIKLALDYLEKAGDHPQALYEIGKIKEKDGKKPEAHDYYKRAAEKNHPQALLKMGEHARNAAEVSPEEVLRFFERARDLEAPGAFYRLGRLHEKNFYKFVNHLKTKTTAIFK